MQGSVSMESEEIEEIAKEIEKIDEEIFKLV